MMRQFTAPGKAAMPYGPQAKLHTQWPGTGGVGDPTADQVACGQGGAFLPDLESTHNIWKLRLGELLPAALSARVGELNEAQLIGLRFASDAELPDLVEETLKTQMGNKQIKQAIKNWRPDDFRI